MDNTRLIELIYIVIANIVLPLLTMWLVILLVKPVKLKKPEKILLYVSSIVAALAAWPLSQLFIPFVVVSDLFVVFLACMFVVKLPIKKSALLSAVYTVIHMILGSLMLYSLPLIFK